MLKYLPNAHIGRRSSLFFLTAIKLEDTDWSYEDAHEQLKQDLAAIADVLRAEETRKMVIVIEVRAWLLHSGPLPPNCTFGVCYSAT